MRTLRALARAAATSRSAWLVLPGADGAPSRRRVDVFALAYDGERWTAAVRDAPGGALRVLDASLVEGVRLTDRRASPPPDGFDGREFAWHPWLERRAGTHAQVQLWADGAAAPVVRSALPVLRLARAPRGGWLCRVRTSRPEGIAALTRALSPHAAVHSAAMSAPASSRDREDTAEARLLRLASWLLGQGEPVTRAQIFEAFPDGYRGSEAAAEKKFTRDKEALRRLGYAIATVELGHREGPGYVLPARACTLPRIELLPEEAALVWSAATAASRLSPHPLREELESALRKLVVGAQGLPPRAAALEELVPDGPPDQEKMLGRLVDAWQRRKRITIAYWRAAADEVVERQVDVYGWASRRGEWIFVGHCHLRDGVRIFYLSRVRRLRVNGVRAQDPDYRIPTDFDVRRWSRQQPWDYDVHPPRPVTVRFRGSLARIARTLLPGATTALDAEGGRVARLEVRNLRGLVRQMLAWGPEAELLAPEEGRALARAVLGHLGAPARGPA